MSTPDLSGLVLETKATLSIAEAIGSPRALTVSLLVEHQQWDQLLDLTIDWRHYEGRPGDFADDYLVTSLLRKSSNLPTGIDTTAVARSQFIEAEAHNERTNERFGMTDAVDHPDWWWACQKYLARILGPLDADVLFEIENLMRHGSGSVVGLSSEQGLVPSKKYDTRPTVTKELSELFTATCPAAWEDYHSIGKWSRIVEGGSWFPVRKDATTDRGCIKPTLAGVFIQLGIGEKLRLRLRRFGIDLTDQSLNQDLASLAESLSLATIDLRQASNMMAREPIRHLLPDRWYHLMDLAREKRVKGVDDSSKESLERFRPLHMFSAMGNGFTFPLETALFLSVVRAIVPTREHVLTAVYGDDIICPQRYALQVVSALEYLGFEVNTRKSCLAGSFFESCGTDWLYGHNVRPFFLRKDTTASDDPEIEYGEDGKVLTDSRWGEIPYALQIANALRLWSQRRAKIDGIDGCDARFCLVWNELVTQVPRKWRLPVPPEFGDSGLLTSFCEAFRKSWTYVPKALIGLTVFDKQIVQGWEGFMVRHMSLKPINLDRKTFGVLLASLARMPLTPGKNLPLTTSALQTPWYGREGLGTTGLEPVRGLFGRPVSKWTSHVGWSDGLDWT